MRARLNISNQKFGKLTALSPSNEQTGTATLWLCRCDCGNLTKKSVTMLRLKRIKSCGCLLTELKHNKVNTQVYRCWSHMIERCKTHKDYAGRNIKVIDRWKDFKNFYKDMGDPPSNKHSIERKDNNGNYEPSNCIWATRKEQNRNTRHNYYVTFQNQTKCLSEWSEILQLNADTLWSRLRTSKWSVEKAFTTPSRVKRGKI